jgi:hypothetical protein
MKRKRKIVAHNWNLVGSGGFFDQWRGTAAIGALQVFEYHNCNLRALRRTQGGIHRLLRRGAQRSREG